MCWSTRAEGEQVSSLGQKFSDGGSGFGDADYAIEVPPIPLDHKDLGVATLGSESIGCFARKLRRKNQIR
jgi:hypothetical protein